MRVVAEESSGAAGWDGRKFLLGGKTASFPIVWVPILPFPIVTTAPIEGVPLTTTNAKAVPGGKRAALGGICRQCKVADPSAL